MLPVSTRLRPVPLPSSDAGTTVRHYVRSSLMDLNERCFLLADLIFKNQTANDKDRGGQFVNDLLRTEFHK